jgi:ribosomal protein S18 acetylase RimI-like enzyme
LDLFNGLSRPFNDLFNLGNPRSSAILRPSMEIEPATPADLPDLCQLLGLLFDQESEFQPDPLKQTAGLTAILENPALGQVLVARETGGCLGMVNLLFTVSTALGGRVAILEDLIVHPDHRGGGLGGRLLESAIRFAQDAGCQRVTLLTDSTNDSAQRFYRRHGFLESSMIPMRLGLGG